MAPIATKQFFDVFVSYNQGVWPAQFILVLLGLVAIAFALQPHTHSRRIVAGVLALLWLWMGTVYFLAFFARVNPAGYVAAALFVAQAGLFTFAALRQQLFARAQWDGFGTVGAAFVVYALIIYPIIGMAAGHGFPASPTFGAPCPTTIFTFGLLLLVDRRVPGYLLVVPFLWVLAGMSAVWMFGVIEDVGLPLAGVIGLWLILKRNRQVADAFLGEALGQSSRQRLGRPSHHPRSITTNS